MDFFAVPGVSANKKRWIEMTKKGYNYFSVFFTQVYKSEFIFTAAIGVLIDNKQLKTQKFRRTQKARSDTF